MSYPFKRSFNSTGSNFGYPSFLAAARKQFKWITCLTKASTD